MKLAAADSEDLEILSARLQDATARLKDVAWLPKQHRFAILFNRYRWEEPKGQGTRIRSGLHFDGVLKVQSQNIKLGAPDGVVSLLDISFTPNGAKENEEADPGGVITLTLSGGGAFRLTVECIQGELADLSGPWAARGKPMHEGER